MTGTPPASAALPSPGDFQALLDLVTSAVLMRCVSVVADLKVADALGDHAATADELAPRIGANAAILARVLRFIAAHGVFVNDNGKFSHNARSRLLRDDHAGSMAALVRQMTDAWPLLGALDYTLRTGRPAAEQAVGGNYWRYLAAHPEVAERFDTGMSSKARFQIASLMPVYDFSGLPSIADVGGGRGHFIKAILAACPHATGVLFDLPQVIEALAEPEDSRLELRSGDFFKDELPPCAAFLLMNVLHDWNDAECVAILRNLRRSATPATKLLIAEAPLPEVDGPHPALMPDIIMMVYATGRERKLSEYRMLFEASGWRLDRVADSGTGTALLESSPV